MTFLQPVISLALIMICGALGGLAGRYISDGDNKSPAAMLAENPVKFLFVGATAALMVPLFLTLASPSTLNPILVSAFSAQATHENHYPHLAILCSYCVLFGMYAKKFAEKLSGYLENKIESANKKAEDAERKIDNLEENTRQALTGQTDEHALRAKAEVPENVMRDRVLRAVNDGGGRYWRAPWSVAQEADIPQTTAIAILDKLSAEKLLEKSDVPAANGSYYYRKN